ncbi:hypothetical protein [Catenovulum agarivorans]|uniref:hypothetical protein n=1 Tax=Catenovulum agarivorans TaxID=1172192 RepID=UPI000474E367|nr:hypothetical protein [Catenovulum agarivorans]
MKLYFLVEGVSSEMQVYPEWIKFFIPSLNYFDSFEDFKSCSSGFFLISGEGYPSILNHLENSSKDIVDIGDVNHFFIILDCDESTVEHREREVKEGIEALNLELNAEITVIIQKRCFETFLLGNNQAIPRQPNDYPLIDYFRYFNVITDDPEEMGAFSTEYTHSQFHAKYAIQALREKRIRYSKSRCDSVATSEYVEKIEQRVNDTEHLKSFTKLANKLKEINHELP